MNWLAEYDIRSKQVMELEGELRRIQKQIKQVGTLDTLEIIRAALDGAHEEHIRIRNDVGSCRRLIAYAPDATPKQIQYGRYEKQLGDLVIQGKGPFLHYICGANKGQMEVLPRTTEEVYTLLVHGKE